MGTHLGQRQKTARIRGSKRESQAQKYFSLLTLPKDNFLSNSANKKKFINLLNAEFKHASTYHVFHAQSDTDVLIVQTGIQIAKDPDTVVVVAEDTDLLVLLYILAHNIWQAIP